MISNKALFSINSAPMLASFLEKSFVRYHEPFVIKFLPEPSFYMCGLRENNASMEVNKERDPQTQRAASERMCHKKLFSIEEMYALSIYKSVPELFYN